MITTPTNGAGGEDTNAIRDAGIVGEAPPDKVSANVVLTIAVVAAAAGGWCVCRETATTQAQGHGASRVF